MTQRRTLLSIQYLRGAAAMAVVAHHTNWTGTVFGASGVDLFFVISGFVMTYVSKEGQTPFDFLRARALRIVPLYWIATLLTAFVERTNDPWHVVQSMLFWPHDGPKGPGYPVVIAGWTLNIEAIFYVIFACSLLLGRTWRTMILTTLLAALGIVGMALHPGEIASSNVINCLFLEFLSGIWLCKTWQRGWLQRAWPLLPVGIAILAKQLGLQQEPTTWRWMSWGVPALLVVAGALGLEQIKKLPRFSTLLLVGDASYAIYLMHMLVLQAVGSVFKSLPALLALPLVMICCAIAGWGMHICVEKPIARLVARRA